MITAAQIEAAHADLVAAGMSPETHRLAATSLARWRVDRDSPLMTEIILRVFAKFSDETIYKLMFGEPRP